MSTPATYFDQMHREDDPWGFRHRWYEERKRKLLLAMLPTRRVRRAWEVGCSSGEFSAALATRCEELLATDGCKRAVQMASLRLQSFAHTKVEQSTQPQDWPEGLFELIVFSEVGYFIGPTELQRCIEQFAPSLDEGGILVACHWRHPFAEATMTGDAVHQMFEAALPLESFMLYKDVDVIIQAWSRMRISVATREGIA